MPKISDNDKFEIKYVDPADHPKAFDGDRINLWDFDEPRRNITVGEIVLDQLKDLKEEYLALPNSGTQEARFELNKFIKWIEKRLSRDYNSN